jgi:tetratricopeptide (TPR) repeat protein
VEVAGLPKLFPLPQSLDEYHQELRVRARGDEALRVAGRSMLRGLQELSAGDLSEALGWLGRAARADAKARGPFSELLLGKGRAALEKKERSKVFPLLKGALNMDPANARVHQALGDYYLTLQADPRKARYHLRRALRMAQEKRRSQAGEP